LVPERTGTTTLGDDLGVGNGDLVEQVAGNLVPVSGQDAAEDGSLDVRLLESSVENKASVTP
jgi:hypothetical protein